MEIQLLDLFCGGGGSGTGLLEGLGLMNYRTRGTFINHWDKAIQIHSHNHPDHRHFCTGVDDLSMEHLYPNNQALTVLFGSPECTHHSTARGGKPMSDQSRATAQCLIRWIRHKRPKFVLVENVPEFRDWGPLAQKRCKKTGKLVWMRVLRYTLARGKVKERLVETTEIPEELAHKPKFMPKPVWLKRLSDAGYEMAMVASKKRKGQRFREWVRRMRTLGYHVEWKVLCAADFGDPTSRKRVFVQAVRHDIGKVFWPNPTHQRRSKQTGEFDRGMLPYRTARDIIEWDDKGFSVFTRARGLKEKTMKRIGVGFKRFVVEPIVQAILDGKLGSIFPGFNVPQQQGGAPAKSSDDPIGPITTKPGEMVVQVEVPAAIIQQQGQSTAQNPDSPLTGMTAGQHHGVLQSEPYIIPQQGFDGRVRSVDNPAPTVTCESRGVGVVQPGPAYQVPLEGVTGGNVARSIDDAVNTVTASRGGGHAARPMLVKLKGTSTVTRVDDPLDTVQSGGLHYAKAIMEAFQMAIDQHGSNGSCIAPIDDPVAATVTKNNRAVVEAQAFVHSSDHRANSGDSVHPIGEPLPAVLTKAKESLVVADPTFVVETAHGQDHRDEGRRVHSPDVPVGAVNASGTNRGPVTAEPMIIQMANVGYDETRVKDPDQPLSPIHAGGGNHAVASPETAFLVPQFGENTGQIPRTHSVDEPAPAATSHGAGALVSGEPAKFEDGVGVLVPYEQSYLIQTAYSGCDDSRVRALLEPLASVAGNRGDMALVRPWIYVYYSSGSVGSPIDAPVPTIRTHDAVGICYPAVEIEGNILVFDIFFRMLNVRELARAQGFRDDYEFPVNKTEAVRAIGNAVPRNLARALVLACIGQDSDVMSRIKHLPEIRDQIETHYTSAEAQEVFGLAHRNGDESSAAEQNE